MSPTLVIARECNDRGDPVIINLFAVANTVLWIATPLTWLAMTKEDCRVLLPCNDKWGDKSRTTIGNNGCISTLSLRVKRSNPGLLCLRAMPAVLFYLLDCHATDVARNDKRRLPGALPCNDKDWG